MGLSSFHPIVSQWFSETLGAPTVAQAQGWAAIRERRHTLIAAPTGSGKTLAAFLTALDDLVQEGLRAPLPDEVRVVYVSPLKALSADIHKNLAEPRRGIVRLAEAAGLEPPRITAAVRTGDTTAVGTRGDAANAAAHPGDDAGVAVSAADGRAQPRDAAHRAHGHRRRNPRGDRHAARRAPGAVARASAAGRRAAAAADRSVGDAEADRRSRAVSGRSAIPIRPSRASGRPELAEGRAAHRRRGTSARDGPRPGAPGLVARSGDVPRGLGGVLQPADRAHRPAPDDADLREHAADGRARRASPERSARRRGGHGASRQPVEGQAARRRVAAQERPAEGARGDGVARARHRHRIGRSRLPDRVAASDRDVPAARRSIGSHHRRDAEGPVVPGVARRSRSNARRCCGRSAAASWIASCRTTRRSTCWRSRSSRRRRAASTARTSCTRWCARAWPYRDLSRQHFDAVVAMAADGFATKRGRRAR